MAVATCSGEVKKKISFTHRTKLHGRLTQVVIVDDGDGREVSIFWTS